MKTLIIAEIGINHNRDMNAAVALIDASIEAGADVVKFQLEVGGDYCPSFEQMRYLYLYCHAAKVRFACTAFDMSSLEFLLEYTELDFIKVASLCYNAKLLAACGRAGKPIILSTGKHELHQIRTTIEQIVGSRLGEASIQAGAITLLHCVSAYPAPYDQTNLRAMEALRAEYHLPVGFSDHSIGIEVPIAAVALGATVIEKHITLSRSLEGPDHKCSATPDEFAAMVSAIRKVELALGAPIKTVQRCEQ